MTVLLSTDFTGADGSAWPSPWVIDSGTATIQANRGRQVTPATQWSDCAARAPVTATTMRLDATVRFPALADRSGRIDFRFTSGDGYRVIVDGGGDGVQLMRVDAWAETTLGSSWGVGLAAATDYRVAVEADGSTLRVKLWAAGSAEPSTWLLTATDATHAGGGVRLVTVNHGTTAATVEWDDVTVDDVIPTSGTTPPVVGTRSQARVGFHNDAIGAPSEDYGTYTTFTSMTAAETRAYTEAQTGAVPMLGESAVLNAPATDYPNMASEFATYHWTALNPHYHQDVLASWTQADKDDAARKLGHRLRLGSVVVSVAGAPPPAQSTELETATATAAALDPTAAIGAATVALETATATAAALDPAVTVGGVTATLETAGATAEALDPATAAGGVTATLEAAGATAEALTPSVGLDVIAVSLEAAAATAEALDVTATLGAATVALETAATAAEALDATVVTGGVAVELATATATAEALTPGITIPGVTITPDTAEARAWALDLEAAPGTATVTLEAAAAVATALDVGAVVRGIELRYPVRMRGRVRDLVTNPISDVDLLWAAGSAMPVAYAAALDLLTPTDRTATPVSIEAAATLRYAAAIATLASVEATLTVVAPPAGTTLVLQDQDEGESL